MNPRASLYLAGALALAVALYIVLKKPPTAAASDAGSLGGFFNPLAADTTHEGGAAATPAATGPTGTGGANLRDVVTGPAQVNGRAPQTPTQRQ